MIMFELLTEKEVGVAVGTDHGCEGAGSLIAAFILTLKT